MSVGNTLTIGVLKSPLHGTMSKGLLVLEYQGRRSGKRYEVPLQYIEDDESLYIWAGNAEDKTWWRNFQEPTPVTAQLRGEEVSATASLVDDPALRAELLRAYVDRYPATTPTGRPKFIGQRWHPTDDELAEVADSIVFVAIDPK
jgi:deazaflavin-dependent oxidoreductase (nitroreductase family)